MKKILKFVWVCVRRASERLSGYFFTFHLRPVYSSGLEAWSTSDSSQSNVCIVMQGPIATEHGFTVNTLELYRKLYPGTPVILSTWKGEDSGSIRKIRALGVEVIENVPPQNRGPQNINMQIVSTRNGIRRAEENGCTHVLKTRTDLRMYAPNALTFLTSLLGAFPGHRIVTTSLNSYKYRLYNASDMTMLGGIDEMLRYWDCPLDARTAVEGPYASILDFARQRLGEVYLCTHYLESMGRTLRWTIEDSWGSYAERFIVADQQSVDLFWFKYGYEREYRRRSYVRLQTDEELGFREWLLLYTGKDQLHSVEGSNLVAAGFCDEVPHPKEPWLNRGTVAAAACRCTSNKLRPE